MYCKHCGKEKDDNSSFCKYCGKPQNDDLKPFRISKGLFFYFIWTLANFYLLMGDKTFNASYVFYPFTKEKKSEMGDWGNTIYCGNWDKSFYDLSEFIVYVFIIPAIIYIVYRRYHTKIDDFINKLLTFNF